jgi:hypothetical protein
MENHILTCVYVGHLSWNNMGMMCLKQAAAHGKHWANQDAKDGKIARSSHSRIMVHSSPIIDVLNVQSSVNFLAQASSPLVFPKSVT